MMVCIVRCLLDNALEAAHLDRGVSASIVLHEVVHVVPVVVSVLHDGFVWSARRFNICFYIIREFKTIIMKYIDWTL